MTQSAWFSSDCLWIAITFSLWKCQLYISGILFTMTSFLLKCLDTNDHEHFSGRLSIGGMPLGWVHFLPGYDHLRTVLLRFCKDALKAWWPECGLAEVIDRWSWLLVVNEWNAAWTVETSAFCVSVSHYKISCHPIILIRQSALVWFICFVFCTGCFSLCEVFFLRKIEIKTNYQKLSLHNLKSIRWPSKFTKS